MEHIDKIAGDAVYKHAKWENKAIEHANRGNDGSTKGAPGEALHHWSNSSATLPPKAREKQPADLRSTNRNTIKASRDATVRRSRWQKWWEEERVDYLEQCPADSADKHARAVELLAGRAE